ncbi:rhomboid family intramembrane serine protease [Propioniciclava sp. MC1683]|uniref:rhomboid family intramembrane serine protease n=1 Tax=Propioniciclava sp. MC1683 TaxID=2760309 RepID=UPI001604455A|nr:rhomboid family intramembrane serine protease [Propioniciclava sp. MC1683]MBB1500242.1 rhomboid family intramembrane serine protease [Propioniciclava sp. MC1683]
MPPFNVSRDHSGDAWFRLGKLDVTSTVLVVLIGAVGVVASAFAPVLYQVGRFVPAEVLQGQVWRAVTWPFVDGISLWSILTLVLLWYFGRDLENQVGRRPMMSLYVALWAILTVVAFVVGLAMGGGAMAGLRSIQFIVLLLWIAENPRRPFFFGIPAWIVGAVLVALQVLSYIAIRDLAGLASLVVTFFVAAVVARRFGLLSDLFWLPGRRGSAPRIRQGGGVRAPQAAAPRTPRAARAEQKAAARQASDHERMDALLEKISEQGIHSLTPAERKELEALRERRRKGR